MGREPRSLDKGREFAEVQLTTATQLPPGAARDRFITLGGTIGDGRRVVLRVTRARRVQIRTSLELLGIRGIREMPSSRTTRRAVRARASARASEHACACLWVRSARARAPVCLSVCLRVLVSLSVCGVPLQPSRNSRACLHTKTTTL